MTAITTPRPSHYDVRALAAWLAANDKPGRRSMTAITLLRRERAKRNTPLVPPTPEALKQRARVWLVERIFQEIQRRGGETEIEGKYDTEYLSIKDRSGRLVLMHAEGWRAYGRGPARRASLSYLWGPDDAGSGPWAVRVPGTVTTVREALAWLTPNEVIRAQDKGLKVRRQGDVYAIETTRAHDGKGVDLLPESHEWRTSTRRLIHRPEDGRKHRPLVLPWPVRFVPQRAYEMGRSGARGAAD